MRTLLIGDVVGKPGRSILQKYLPSLRSSHRVDFVIANGENASDGKGLSRENFYELLNYGIDVITMGDHIWDKKDLQEVMDKTDFLLRPANYPPTAPGKGFSLVNIGGVLTGVVNLQARTFMNPPIDCPFVTAQKILDQLRPSTQIIFVDFHGETTSEKMAMGWFLDGKVSVVVGTHTHVPTDDLRILPAGTAYVTDLGMTGPVDSVIGMASDDILKRFLTGVYVPFNVAKKGKVQINGVLVDVDNTTGRALYVQRIRVEAQMDDLFSS